MRKTTRSLIEHYIAELDLAGDVLEIGGHDEAKSGRELFPSPRFTFHHLDLQASDIPNTIVADITDCRAEIPDGAFDVVVSSDVFEHIDRPWLAAAEIGRILRPGGVVFTHTVWSWRNHPCPIDYWRFSPECLEFLFADLELLEKGYDLSQRRKNQTGKWPNARDSVPVDELGGWREHWSVYCVNRKGPGPPVAPFKSTTHPHAVFLRMDTQGTLTNRRLIAERAARRAARRGVPVEPPGRLARWRGRAIRRGRRTIARAARLVRRGAARVEAAAMGELPFERPAVARPAGGMEPARGRRPPHRSGARLET